MRIFYILVETAIYLGIAYRMWSVSPSVWGWGGPPSLQMEILPGKLR